ncbi:MAG: hypothetical protein L3J11_08850 [Draconibacterium sp.]|nr:hypothetical protein [Draconibacterium sp.]
MLQDIITYMIIGSAVTLAILKIAKKLGKKKRNQKINAKKNSFSMQHDCSSCSAECMLRDAAEPIIQNNIDLCKKVDIKSDQL